MNAVETSEIVRNYALVAAGIIGVAIAFWRAFAADRQAAAQKEQVAQSRREHVAGLFSDAVGRLDEERLHVRLGAVFTLREIVEAFPELSRPTVDLLSSYLSSVDYGDEEPPADVEAIMSILIPMQGED